MGALIVVVAKLAEVVQIETVDVVVFVAVVTVEVVLIVERTRDIQKLPAQNVAEVVREHSNPVVQAGTLPGLFSSGAWW